MSKDYAAMKMIRAAVAIAIFLLSVAGIASKGAGQPMSRDEFISLSVIPATVGSPYPESTTDERVGNWLYPEEPLTAIVTIWNNTRDTLRLPTLPREWYATARIVVRDARTSGLRAGPNTSQPLNWAWELSGASRRRIVGVGVTVVPPNGIDRVQYLLRTNTATLPPGIYELSVEWDPSVIPESLRNRTKLRNDMVLLGVRGLDTRLDQLNQAAHMAIRANNGRDFAGTREWARRVLALNPSSAFGLTYLGHADAGLKNCRDAIANWERAATIVRAGSDPDAPTASPAEIEVKASSLQGKISQCR
jgi:hypothetical protein